MPWVGLACVRWCAVWLLVSVGYGASIDSVEVDEKLVKSSYFDLESTGRSVG